MLENLLILIYEELCLKCVSVTGRIDMYKVEPQIEKTVIKVEDLNKALFVFKIRTYLHVIVHALASTAVFDLPFYLCMS